MPRLNVSFDAEQMRALQQLAAELGCSPAEMVRRAVDHYVATQLADDDAWRERLTDFLARVRGQLPVTVPPQEIESEITAAREEVRQAHRASGGR